eukprot:GGOE01060950.1.p1 GENE.GGOE01060950.1~~GGOE01060950.1.p1  ORF type:complete len:174 (-),score=56.57 GGOE01060950.1:196-717(-)
MAPKKPKGDGEKSPKVSKKQKQLEEQQRREEEMQQQRETLENEESQYRGNMVLMETVERTETRLARNDEHIATMVNKKKYEQLMQQHRELRNQSTTEKAQLEKQMAQLTKAKDTLEKELNDLKGQFKVDSVELALIKKKLEGEMSSQGKCFVCVECTKTIYKDRPRGGADLLE